MMHLIIVSKNKEVFKGKVDSVKLPSSMGRLQVLKNHMPLVCILVEGVIVYKWNKKEYKISTTSGIAKVFNNKVRVLLDSD